MRDPLNDRPNVYRRGRVRTWRTLAVIAGVVLTIGVAFSASHSSRAADSQSDYVDSRLCASCHANVYETYRRTGMARSFYRPRPENAVEDYRANNSYYHAASDEHFTIIERDGKYYQRRYQIGFQGKETNVDEKEIDFVMGSGNHVRSYLHRTSAGELQELPWPGIQKSGGHWAMNPGYDKQDQLDSLRKIDYGCMFCHNSYPEIPAKHGQLRSEPVFADVLPEGIDCQRCHGPGRQHIQATQDPHPTLQAIRNAIVNPARLAPERQMEVCMQCHLETTSFPFPQSIAKYDREPFSYRPGQPLADFLLYFDHAPTQPKEDRFQIVNSVYRLRMSQCFLKSNGALKCTTCHNPHNVPHDASATEHYNATCRQCHAVAFDARVASKQHTASTNCIGCHMPKRRTDDVVHAVMTDHYIQRNKPGRDLLAEKIEPESPENLYRGEVIPYYPTPFQPIAENELYLALAQVRDDNNLERGINQFGAALEKYRPAQTEFYIELADARLRRQQANEAIPLYEEALRRKPDSLAGLLGSGAALEKSGQLDKAAGTFQRATFSYIPTTPDSGRGWRESMWIRGESGGSSGFAKRSAIGIGRVPEAHVAMGRLLGQSGRRLARSRSVHARSNSFVAEFLAQAHV